MRFIAVLVTLLSLCGCGEFEWLPGETPSAFTFKDQTDVPLDTVVVSESVKLTGFVSEAEISIQGGEYSTDGATWTSKKGKVYPNQLLEVRHLSADAFNSERFTYVKVGDYRTTFRSVTAGPNSVPDAFNFKSPQLPVDVTVSPSEIGGAGSGVFANYSSNAVTITGINIPATLTLTGDGVITIDGAVLTTSSTSVVNDQIIKVFHNVTTASKLKTTVTIDGVFSTYSTTGKLP